MKLTPFKRWTLENFPFIEADFDAITNYQLYCKIVEYLNIVIKEVEEMKAYLNDLDIQEAVNNKLDEMAEEGTLQEIISDYLNTKAIFAFDNVNALKNATNLINGSYAETLGYYTIKDGGQSLYKIVDDENLTANDSDIIELNSGLKAILIPYNNTIKLKQFGAYGNGVNDDSESIQNAIDYALTHDNICLESDRATYKIDTTLNIIDNDVTYKSLIFDFSKASFITEDNITIFQVAKPWLKLYINELLGSGTGTGILLSGSNWHETINIDTIRGFEYGIKMLPTQVTNNGIMYTNIKWTYMTNTYNIYADINGSYINQNKFTGGLVGGGSGTYGIYVTNSAENPTNLNFNGNIFEHVGFEIVSYPIHLEHCAYSIFKDVRFEEQPLSNDYIKLIDCVCMIFETNNSYMFIANKINDDHTVSDAEIMNWKKYCNIYKIYAGNSQTPQNSTTSREFTMINGHVIYLDFRKYDGQYNYFESTGTQSDFTATYSPLTYFEFVAGTNDINLTLTEPYSFLHSGYDDIIINIKSLVSPHKVVIKDYLNNTIFDSSNYSITAGTNINKKFEIKLTGRKNVFVVKQLN